MQQPQPRKLIELCAAGHLIGYAPFGQAVTIVLQPITLGAAPLDTVGLVDHVSFYAGSALLGSASNSPYEFAWTNAVAGSYALRAQVAKTAVKPRKAAATKKTTEKTTKAKKPPAKKATTSARKA